MSLLAYSEKLKVNMLFVAGATSPRRGEAVSQASVLVTTGHHRYVDSLHCATCEGGIGGDVVKQGDALGRRGGGGQNAHLDMKMTRCRTGSSDGCYRRKRPLCLRASS